MCVHWTVYHLLVNANYPSDADFRPLLNEYLEGLEESSVRSLKDIIEFNEAHADLELPPGKRELLEPHQDINILILN